MMMESDEKIRRSNQEKKQVEIIEVKKEPEEELEIEMVLPTTEEEDPLKIDNIDRNELQKFPVQRRHTGYLLWSAVKRKELLKATPHLSFSEISKRLSKKWKRVSENVRNNYRRQAFCLNESSRQARQPSRPRKPRKVKDLSQFVRNKEKYENTETLESIKGGNKPKKIFEIKKVKSKYTSYTLWAQKVRVVLLKESPGISFTEVSKKLSQMWKKLSNNEKYSYHRRAKRITEKLSKSWSENDVTEEEKNGEVTSDTSKEKVLSNTSKLSDFVKLEPNSKIKAEPLVTDQDSVTDTPLERQENESQNWKIRDKESSDQVPITVTLIGNREQENGGFKFDKQSPD